MRELIDEVRVDRNGYVFLKLKGELVRCGECKKKHTANCPLMYGRITSRRGNDSWFCADGERKDGEHE